MYYPKFFVVLIILISTVSLGLSGVDPNRSFYVLNTSKQIESVDNKRIILDLPMNEGQGEKIYDTSDNRYIGNLRDPRWEGNLLYFDGSSNDQYVELDERADDSVLSDPSGNNITWEFKVNNLNSGTIIPLCYRHRWRIDFLWVLCISQ